MPPSSAALPPTYPETRVALQSVAEHVLSAALYDASGHVGLRAAPGGFATPIFADRARSRDRRIAVEGVQLVTWEGDGSTRRATLSTLAAAAGFVGVVPGAPVEVYTPATPLDLDAPLRVDAAAAQVLADWFAITSSALESFRAEFAADEPSMAQLWPEHFDLAVSSAEVNYGGSPGDTDHAGPYLYVGPWSPPPVGAAGGFWNESFGASRGYEEVTTAEDALAFFREGRALVAGA